MANQAAWPRKNESTKKFLETSGGTFAIDVATSLSQRLVSSGSHPARPPPAASWLLGAVPTAVNGRAIAVEAKLSWVLDFTDHLPEACAQATAERSSARMSPDGYLD